MIGSCDKVWTNQRGLFQSRAVFEMGRPWPLLVIFGIFKQQYNFFTTNKCENDPSTMQCRDSNSVDTLFWNYFMRFPPARCFHLVHFLLLYPHDKDDDHRQQHVQVADSPLQWKPSSKKPLIQCDQMLKIKSSPHFPKNCPESSHGSFYFEMMFSLSPKSHHTSGFQCVNMFPRFELMTFLS